MKKAVIILLVFSIIGNAALGIVAGRLYYESQAREQENATQTLSAMQGFLNMNDILQKTIKDGFIERHELSSIQHQIIYIQAAFDRTQHLLSNEINNENYHISFAYLTALEDIIFKIENIKPLDKDILKALTDSDSVAGGQYKYTLAEYIQLMATKIDEAIAQLNIQEQPASVEKGGIIIYSTLPEIKKAFIDLFK